MAATLEWRYTGGGANSDPDASLGGTASSEAVVAGPLNNLFDNTTPAEATAGDVEYRAISLYNDGDATGKVIEIWLSTETPSSDSVIAISLDSGVQSIVDEDTAPTEGGISWVHPLTGSKQAISDIAAAGAQRIWIRRTISNSAGNYADDLVQISVQYA